MAQKPSWGVTAIRCVWASVVWGFFGSGGLKARSRIPWRRREKTQVHPAEEGGNNNSCVSLGGQWGTPLCPRARDPAVAPVGYSRRPSPAARARRPGTWLRVLRGPRAPSPAQPLRCQPARALRAKTGKGPFPRAPPRDRQKGPRAGGLAEWRRPAATREASRAAHAGCLQRHGVRARPPVEERAITRRRHYSPGKREGGAGDEEIEAAAGATGRACGRRAHGPGRRHQGQLRGTHDLPRKQPRGDLSSREEETRSERRQPSL